MTVLELMVAVSLLTLIIVSLYSVFERIQRAFRHSANQADVLESGRAVNDLITRELEQIVPGKLAGGANFYAQILTDTNAASPGYNYPYTLVQTTPDGTTNHLQFWDLLFHNRQLADQPDRWRAVGYAVRNSTNVYEPPDDSVGALYRFEYTFVRATNMIAHTNFFNLSLVTWPLKAFQDVSYPNLFQKVLDGVVHFSVRSYDQNGAPIQDNTTTVTNDVLVVSNAVGNASLVMTYAGKVPCFVDLEMGVLEPTTLQTIRGFPTPQIRTSFLANQTSKIHMFRQRVPVRTGL
jgi:hypothetical protein